MKIFRTKEIRLTDMGTEELREELIERELDRRLFGGIVCGIFLGMLLLGFIASGISEYQKQQTETQNTTCASK